MVSKHAKWFHAAQKAAETLLDARYPVREVVYQLVTEDKVINGYLGSNGDGLYTKLEVHIAKGQFTSAQVYELKPIALTPVNEAAPAATAGD